MMKQLFYDVTPQAQLLGMMLSDYEHVCGKYKVTRNNKWILTPKALNDLLRDGYITDNGVWPAWQDLLRQAAYINQSGKSLITDAPLDLYKMQLHHALITKGRVRGMSNFRKNLIHHTYNVMLLNQEEHLDGQDMADNREFCAKILGDLYGKAAVKGWYFTAIPFKTSLANIF